MLGSGKNREQKKENKYNKGQRGHNSIYSQKHIRKKQEILENKNMNITDEKKPKKQKGGYFMIINPKNGKKFDIFSESGKKILSKYLDTLYKHT